MNWIFEPWVHKLLIVAVWVLVGLSAAMWKSDQRGMILWTLLIVVIAWDFTRPLDSTDDVENRTRSGMKLYTDYGTGCQYVRASLFGPAVPRIDRDGEPVCVDVTKKEVGNG